MENNEPFDKEIAHYKGHLNIQKGFLIKSGQKIKEKVNQCIRDNEIRMEQEIEFYKDCINSLSKNMMWKKYEFLDKLRAIDEEYDEKSEALLNKYVKIRNSEFEKLKEKVTSGAVERRIHHETGVQRYIQKKEREFDEVYEEQKRIMATRYKGAMKIAKAVTTNMLNTDVTKIKIKIRPVEVRDGADGGTEESGENIIKVKNENGVYVPFNESEYQNNQTKVVNEIVPEKVQTLQIELDNMKTIVNQMIEKQNTMETNLNIVNEDVDSICIILDENNKTFKQKSKEIDSNIGVIMEKVEKMEINHAENNSKIDYLKEEFSKFGENLQNFESKCNKSKLGLEVVLKDTKEKIEKTMECVGLMKICVPVGLEHPKIRTSLSDMELYEMNGNIGQMVYKSIRETQFDVKNMISHQLNLHNEFTKNIGVYVSKISARLHSLELECRQVDNLFKVERVTNKCLEPIRDMITKLTNKTSEEIKMVKEEVFEKIMKYDDMDFRKWASINNMRHYMSEVGFIMKDDIEPILNRLENLDLKIMVHDSNIQNIKDDEKIKLLEDPEITDITLLNGPKIRKEKDIRRIDRRNAMFEYGVHCEKLEKSMKDGNPEKIKKYKELCDRAKLGIWNEMSDEDDIDCSDNSSCDSDDDSDYGDPLTAEEEKIVNEVLTFISTQQRSNRG